MYSVAFSGDCSMIAGTQGIGVVFSIALANVEFSSAISSPAALGNKTRVHVQSMGTRPGAVLHQLLPRRRSPRNPRFLRFNA
jgi:hypothetical protein